MASISIGDFIAVSTFLKKVCTDCKSASGDFSDLGQFVETARYAVDSARFAIENVFERLPWVHKQSISSALWGLHGVAQELGAELNKYSRMNDADAGMKSFAARVKFVMLENPRDAEMKLSARVSMLNTCISAVICDAVTRSRMPAYDPAQMVSQSKQLTIQAHAVEQSGSTTGPLRTSKTLPLSRWITNPTGEPVERRWYSLSRKQLAGPSISARGFYDYQPDIPLPNGMTRMDTVEYEVRVSSRRITGTCTDSLGTASISGIVDAAGLSVCFTKAYTSPLRMIGTKWEYSGTCTECGIVGEWFHPGDPVELAFFRGRFGMWLREDEEGKDAEAVSQIEALSRDGRVLSRAGTFKER